MMNFVNHGSDEDLLKSLQNDERIDQEILEKAIDKSKLVQVERQVQGKNKMFTRKQWVKAGDVQSTDKIIDGQQIQKDNKKPNDSKSSDTKPQQPKQNSPKPNDSKSSDTKPQQPKQKSTYFKAEQATKTKVAQMSSEMGNDKLLQFAKDNGITWSEHDHKGINVMRMKMALAQAIQEGKVSVGPKTSGTEKQNEPKQSEDTHGVLKGFDPKGDMPKGVKPITTKSGTYITIDDKQTSVEDANAVLEYYKAKSHTSERNNDGKFYYNTGFSKKDAIDWWGDKLVLQGTINGKTVCISSAGYTGNQTAYPMFSGRNHKYLGLFTPEKFVKLSESTGKLYGAD